MDTPRISPSMPPWHMGDCGVTSPDVGSYTTLILAQNGPKKGSKKGPKRGVFDHPRGPDQGVWTTSRTSSEVPKQVFHAKTPFGGGQDDLPKQVIYAKTPFGGVQIPLQTPLHEVSGTSQIGCFMRKPRLEGVRMTSSNR